MIEARGGAAELTGARLLEMYELMVTGRVLESRLVDLVVGGRVPGTSHPGTGQEAAMVGLASALEGDDVFAGTHRDLTAQLTRGVTVEQAVLSHFGKAASPTRGRDGGANFGSPGVGSLMVVSPLAGGYPVAVGAALAFAVRGEARVAMADCGEGATATGTWHEAVNLAAVLTLPVVFTVQNNQFANTSRNDREFRLAYVAHRADGYGISGVVVDGNDVLECYAAARDAVERARAGEGPTLIEAVTFRRAGHDATDPADYVPAALRAEWERLDPIERFEEYLGSRGYLDEQRRDHIAARVAERVGTAIEWASGQPDPDSGHVASDVYAVRFAEPAPAPPPGGSQATLAEAVRDAIGDEMERDERVLVFGPDVVSGSEAGVTGGLAERFGPMRVIDTPASAAALVGAAVGAAVEGLRPLAAFGAADDLYQGLDELVSVAATYHWKTGVPVPMVLWAPGGAGSRSGPGRSRSLEGLLVHQPGLKVAVPATAAAARGLMTAAIRDPNPVVVLGHRRLLRGPASAVPTGAYEIPLGRARVAHPGTDVTLVAWGSMVATSLEAADALGDEGVAVEVIDLQTLMPLDWDTVFTSVSATSRLVVVQEDVPFAGVAAEIAARVASELIWDLDAPVVRLAPPHTHVPFSPGLEDAFLPQVEDVLEAVRTLANT